MGFFSLKSLFVMIRSIALVLRSLCLLCIVPFESRAQINWIDITKEQGLPQGIEAFRDAGNSTTSESRFYLVVDPKNPFIQFETLLVPTKDQVNTLATTYGYLAAINGGYFDLTNNTSYSSVITNGNVRSRNVTALTRNGKSYPVIRSLFHLDQSLNPGIHWVYHYSLAASDVFSFTTPLPYAQTSDPLPVPSQQSGTRLQNLNMAIGGGPVLVRNGTVNITYNQEIFWGSGVDRNAERERTAIGYRADGKIVLFVSTINMSLDQTAETMIALGCTHAMNLDGGGSSALSLNKKTWVTSGRSVPSIVGIKYTGTSTSIKQDEPSEVPESFTLNPPYPNPFNPHLKINYTLHESQQIQVKILDLLGRPLRTLIQPEWKPAGHYELEWNADTLASGIYLVVLESRTSDLNHKAVRQYQKVTLLK